MPHLLSSIITFGIFYGVAQYISGSYVSLSAHTNPLIFSALSRQYPELCALVLISCAVLVLALFFFKTQLGYALAVFVNNARFFEHYKISTNFVFITGIAIANALAGLSGYIFAQSNGFIELGMGTGKILLCITALIMGRAFTYTRARPTVKVPVLGALSYFLLQQLLLKIGFNLKYFTTLQAIVVLLLLIGAYARNAQVGRASLNDQLGV